MLDFDFDKEEKPAAEPEDVPAEVLIGAEVELPVAGKPEKASPVIDPHEEEWAFSSPPEPEEEKSSLLDFDF